MASVAAVNGFARFSRGLGVPLLMLTMLGMMIVPMHPFALDTLFTFNIALSLAILLTVVYVQRPLEFAVFPTVLLIVTLLRLALNIASTRVVLLEGHTGTGAAGRVIEAFGNFVIGGDYAVGLVVFSILVIINFVVVTKGAGRVSEVTARFTLDSMPGKQMAIDADLNAGLIDQNEARQRRQEVREEADFYGAMDGSSKFVRGDAIAGILILFINIIGGLVIGTVRHDMGLSAAMQNYTLLTIGDGLVAQIPSLLLSTAVAVIITRVSKPQDMARQMLSQIFADPRVLGVTAGVMLTLGLIPGMPNFAFLTLAAGAGYGAWRSARRQPESAEPAAESAEPEQPAQPKELSWDDVSPVDTVGLEVGYRLIPLVDRNRGGPLVSRIKGVRKKLTEELGFLIPAVHIRDNLDLAPVGYRISLMGVPVGEGEVHMDKELAINPGQVFGELQGIATKDPAFGMQAVWIDPSQNEEAQMLGYTVVDASTVVATHISQLLSTHAAELLGHEEAQQLLDKLGETAPKLVEELTPKTLPMATVVRVLQMLLAENIPVRNIRRIAETLTEQGPKTQDPEQLVAAVRVALGRSIVQGVAGMREELPVLTLEPELEQLLTESTRNGATAGLEPGLVERIHRVLSENAERQEAAGEPAVLLVAPGIRPWLSKLMRGIRNLHVLAYNEIPEDKQIRMVGAVGN
ncbi:flagellar biosynthesis protein FlhA [Lentisalinibacter salinarum]|uniref:flagellar biosynthesis protein FlhA n=1 Tax=Lentisalinibacter salinarum TaxID=2992239 RepID=UPI00386F9FF8